MRNPFRPALLVIALVVSACASENPVGPSEVSSTESLIAALRQNGATARLGDVLRRESNPFFSANAQVVFVADGDVANVSPDGSFVGSTVITWIGPPHFFKKDRLIVIYSGSADAVLRPLEAVLGPPFAGR